MTFDQVSSKAEESSSCHVWPCLGSKSSVFSEVIVLETIFRVQVPISMRCEPVWQKKKKSLLPTHQVYSLWTSVYTSYWQETVWSTDPPTWTKLPWRGHKKEPVLNLQNRTRLKTKENLMWHRLNLNQSQFKTLQTLYCRYWTDGHCGTR